MEIPVEENESPTAETEVVVTDDQDEVAIDKVEPDDGSVTMINAPETGGDATTTTDSVEKLGEDEAGAEKISLPEFMQVLQELGIDVKKHEAGLKEFAEKCSMLGITDIINDPNKDPEEIEVFIKESLVGAEDNPEEGLKKFAAISGLVLEGLKNLGDFAGESTQEFFKGGMGRLIDALIRGAGNNSASSIRQRESESPEKVVGSDEFFKLMREDSTKVVSGLLEKKSDLKKAGWDIGDKGWEMLNKGKGDSRFAKKALLEIFVGENQDGITSLAELLNTKADHNTFWEEVSPVLATVFGDEKSMVSLDAKELLQRMGTGDQTATDNAYFGKLE